MSILILPHSPSCVFVRLFLPRPAKFRPPDQRQPLLTPHNVVATSGSLTSSDVLPLHSVCNKLKRSVLFPDAHELLLIPDAMICSSSVSNASINSSILGGDYFWCGCQLCCLLYGIVPMTFLAGYQVRPLPYHMEHDGRSSSTVPAVCSLYPHVLNNGSNASTHRRFPSRRHRVDTYLLRTSKYPVSRIRPQSPAPLAPFPPSK